MGLRTAARIFSLLFFLQQAHASAQDLYVDAVSPSVPGTGTELDPFRAIQHGIDAAIPGQTVVVRTGTYTGPDNTNLDFAGKDIELTCLSGCVIDAQDTATAFHFHSGETKLAAVRNFRILAGRGDPSGGGLLIESSSPTIRSCVFDRCSALTGGAVHIDGGSPAFSFCSFLRNHAEDAGGAVSTAAGAPSFRDCIFDQNTSAVGGALYLLQSQIDAANSFFLRSRADGDGGAVAANGSTGVFDQCIFVSNVSGDRGGGMRLENASTITLKHSQLALNEAIDGGGVQCSDSELVLTNDLFAFNRAGAFGGGLHVIDCDPAVTNNTLVYNEADVGGGALFGRSCDASITNTISRLNFPEEFVFDDLSSPVVTHSNIEGGWAGDAVADEDPLFGPGPSGQFYLWHTDAGQPEDSLMIDAGLATPETEGLAAFTTRRDNVPDTGTVDIGFHYAPFAFGVTPNDADRDDDVDLVDMQRLQNCYTGSFTDASAPLQTPCWRFDFDSNLSVEPDDYAEFARDMIGP